MIPEAIEMLDGLQVKEKFIELAGSHLANPSLIILFISIFLIFLLMGLLSVRADRWKFIKIWFFSLILSLGVLIAIILLPNTIVKIAEWFRGLI